MQQTIFVALLLMVILCVVQPEARSLTEVDTRLHKRSPEGESEGSGNEGKEGGSKDPFGFKKAIQKVHDTVTEVMDKAHKMFKDAAKAAKDAFHSLADRVQSWFVGKIRTSVAGTNNDNNGGGNEGSGGNDNGNTNANNETR